MKDNELTFNIYRKPTNSLPHLYYLTKNNIALSLGQRIIQIVSENKQQNLNKLKSCLIQGGHPEEFLDYTKTKPFSPSFKSQN